MFTPLFARRVLLPVIATLLVPLAAHAQELQLFSWSGRVDREVRLTVRGMQLSNSIENSISQRGRFRNLSALPAQDGTVRVVSDAGRGDIAVIQQPSSGNGYSAIIRIVDNEGGADAYRVSAYWTPTNDGRYARNRGDNRGRGEDQRNGDYGRPGDNGRNGEYGRNGAQYGQMLRWSGDVDGEVQLVLRDGSVSQRLINGNVVRRANSNMTGDARNESSGQVNVNVREGRGQVEVLQQPNSRNRYTTVIRIVDPQAGYGHYNLEATWR